MDRCYIYRVPVAVADMFSALDKTFFADHSARLYRHWNYEDGQPWAVFAFLSDHVSDHNLIRHNAERLGGGLVF